MPDVRQRTLAEYGSVPGAMVQVRLTELSIEENTTAARTSPTEEAWSPGASDSQFACARCDNRVSPSFYRVWKVDGELNGCPECVPRSVRFGEDVYGRDVDDIEGFDKDRHNKGKDPGGVQEQAKPEVQATSR